MQIPYYEPTGNGEVITDSLFVTPEGQLLFGHAYSGRQMRVRHGAEKDVMLKVGDRVRVTVEVLDDE